MKPIHERAVEWAIERGYYLSVTDLCCSIFNDDPDDDEWDVKHSQDKAAIMDAIDATDIPNVHIFLSADDASRQIVFSVINEGVPDETINDYTLGSKPAAQAFDQWFNKTCDEMSR